MKKLLLVTALALSASAFAASTTNKTPTNTTANTNTTMANPSGGTATAPTDAEISNTLMTANTEEMTMAKLAKTNAADPKVKEFAEMMLKDHAMNNDKAQALATEEKINLKETGKSMKMKFSAEDKVEKLKTMKGKEFDKEYMLTQVEMHRKVLTELDSNLIPNAKSEKLKTMLTETRGKVEKHLKHAESVQSSLK